MDGRRTGARAWRASRWWEWVRRYAPLEAGALLAALTVGLTVSRATGDAASAAVAASFAEAVGYYAVAGVLEVRRQRGRLGPGGGRLAVGGRAVRGLLVEFGPADLLDTLLLRPLLLYAGQVLTGDVATGLVLGKVAADVVFYAVAIPCYELRKRVLRDTGPVPAPRTEARPLVSGTQVVPLPPVAAEATPYLRLDLGQVAQRYAELGRALPGTALHYAMKCNPDPRVLRLLHGLGCGFEIASARELDDLVAVGVDPADVLFSNPVKVPRDVRHAAALGVRRFSCDSSAELAKVAEHAPGRAVYLRVAVEAAASEVPSEGKFGVGPRDVVRLALEARDLGLEVHGLTFHVGSQMTDVLAWETAIERCGALLRRLDDLGLRVSLLDIGGGFPARYADPVPSPEDVGAVVRSALARHLPYPVAVAAEPGRVLVAEAGTMVATVIGLAERGGRRWVHLDVGAFNGFMEALETGNRLRYPVSDSRGSRDRIPCRLTGPTCDSQDTILLDALLSADLAVGDTVEIGGAGAYTTAYASTFNGFDVPAVRTVQPVHVPVGV